jgi:hypothetical protein
VTVPFAFQELNLPVQFIDDTPELFKLVQSQNRAQKLLAYLGDLSVNGSSIKGQMVRVYFSPTSFDVNSPVLGRAWLKGRDCNPNAQPSRNWCAFERISTVSERLEEHHC